MKQKPEIVTSGSAYSAWMRCPRRRWWEYEAPAGEEGQRGWEPRILSMPLATGGWCHRVVEGLALLAIGGDLSDWAGFLPVDAYHTPANVQEVIQATVAGYRMEASRRGIELGLDLTGFVSEEKFIERTIEEQAALLEAFGWAYNRVRLPRLLGEYEIVSIEQEEFALLSGDVGLQARIDMVLRRRIDGKVFVYNLKTSGAIGDKRWRDQWEVDQQLMTETLAVERRLGKEVSGVIIDGFDKGSRVNVWWDDLKEVRAEREGAEKWQAQRSRLIYGYKCEDIPGRPTMYDYEGTTRKGWGKFAVWESERSVENWVNWLPVEVVEAQFVTLPPIQRSQAHMEAKVRQMVEVERRIAVSRGLLDTTIEHKQRMLDENFPQNEHSCTYPTRCPMYRLCWEPGCADDPAAAGYQPRTPNHPEVE